MKTTITGFLEISRNSNCEVDTQEVATQPHFLKNAKQFEARAITLLSDTLSHAFLDKCIEMDCMLSVNFEYSYAYNYEDESISTSKLTNCRVRVRLAKKTNISIFEEIDSAYQSRSIAENSTEILLPNTEEMFFISILDKEILDSYRFESAFNFCQNQINDEQVDWLVPLLAKHHACNLITIKKRSIQNFIEKLNKKTDYGTMDVFQQQIIRNLQLPITDLNKDTLLNRDFIQMLELLIENKAGIFYDKNGCKDGQPLLSCLWSMKIPCCTSAFLFFCDVLCVDVLDSNKQTTFYKKPNRNNGEHEDISCSISDADFFRLRSFADECIESSSIAYSQNIEIAKNNFRLLSQIIRSIVHTGGDLEGGGDVDYLLFGGCPNVYKDALFWDGELCPLFQIDASDVDEFHDAVDFL